MSVQLSSKDRMRTFLLLPLYIAFFIVLLIIIIFVSFLPYGRILGTKLYNFFGLSGLKVAGINLKVTGADKIDTTQSYVVISNHPSTLDIFTHITALPVSIRFLTKTELFRIPLLSRALKVLGLPRGSARMIGRRWGSRGIYLFQVQVTSLTLSRTGTSAFDKQKGAEFVTGARTVLLSPEIWKRKSPE